MRRCTVLVGVYQEAELGVDLLLGQTQRLKHLLLQLVVGDADGTAQQLDAVDHHVVRLGTNRTRVAVDIGQALLQRHGKGVMHGKPALALLVPLKERELGDPQEVVLSFRNQPQLTAQCQAQLAQHRQHHAVLVRHNQHHVALFAAQEGQQTGKLLLIHKLRKRAVRLLLRPADIGQTLGADALGLLGQLVDGLAGEGGCGVLGDDAAHRAALRNRVCKDREAAVLDLLGQVNQLHAKAGVRLVRTEALHRLAVGQPWHLGDIDALDLLVQPLHVALQHVHDVLLGDKGHLQVDLGEFRLAVGAQVLVAEAAGQLDIAVKAGQHQQLLIDLRGLRQSVELAVMDSGRNQIVARALWGGLDEHRGLDLQKVVLIEVVAGDLGNLVAQNHLFLQRLAAQVEIAVF